LLPYGLKIRNFILKLSNMKAKEKIISCKFRRVGTWSELITEMFYFELQKIEASSRGLVCF